MAKGLRVSAAIALSLSLFTFVPTSMPLASAAACSPTYGTVSGTTRYAIFNSGTACTWSVPSGITSLSYLAVGGGGGGGGARAAASSPNLGGGGGGAGGVVIASTLSVAGGATVTLTIGMGGAGGAASTNGTNGGATTIAYSSTTLTANGGNAGQGSNGTFDQFNLSGDGGSNTSFSGGGNDWDGGGGGAGAGANGSNGIDIGSQGGTGGAGGAGVSNTLLGVTNFYGGGGGGGGTPPTNSNETSGFGGTGGSSVGGSGGGGAGVLPTAGSANTGSGGGGGGWRSASSDALRAGASGSDGTIIFVYTKATTTIDSVAITTNSGTDNTYKSTDIIRVSVTMSDSATVTGSPRIPVLGLNSKFFTYSSGTGTRTLVFAYTVATGDSATAGVGITANTLSLNSGTITDTGGLAVTLTHGAIAQSASHQADGILPTFVGVTQSFSLAENISRTISLPTSESATVSFSGGWDSAFFTLNTSVYPATLTISARDFENKQDGDANNVYYVPLILTDLAGNRTGAQNFTVTITDVAEAAAVGAPTLATEAKKGVVSVLTVTADVAGKFTFFNNGKRVAGCINIAATGTAPSMTAQCNWKPATRSPANLYAIFTPTSSGFLGSRTITLTVLPGTRSNNR